MNSVNLIGNIAGDLNLRTAQTKDGEKSVLTFPIAIDNAGDAGKDGSTGFFDVTCWNGQAEAVAKYLGKGSKVGVEGQLRQRHYEKDGNTVWRVEVANARVSFCDSPKNGGGQATSDEVAQAATPATAAPAAPAPGNDNIPF